MEDGPRAFGKPSTSEISLEDTKPERPTFVYEEISDPGLNIPIDVINLAMETPIYFDPEEICYYYPEVELLEEIRYPRKILQDIPKFLYDESTDSYQHPDIGWKYFKVFEPQDFEKHRSITSKIPNDAIYEQRAKETPIYIEPDSNKFLYPTMALFEINEYPRTTVCGKAPDVGYVEMVNSEQFELTKRSFVEKTQKEISLSGPIYFDRQLGLYFYPLEAGVEKVATKRDLWQRSCPLKYDAIERIFYDLYTKDQYFVVKSSLSFFDVRRKLLNGEDLPPQQPLHGVETKVS